jgi:hypothetical protein
MDQSPLPVWHKVIVADVAPAMRARAVPALPVHAFKAHVREDAVPVWMPLVLGQIASRPPVDL